MTRRPKSQLQERLYQATFTSSQHDYSNMIMNRQQKTSESSRITFKMLGVIMLGPLDEKEATTGALESNTVLLLCILATGFLNPQQNISTADDVYVNLL